MNLSPEDQALWDAADDAMRRCDDADDWYSAEDRDVIPDSEDWPFIALANPVRIQALLTELSEARAERDRHMALTNSNARIVAAFKAGRTGSSGCACVLDEDGDTILRWCAVHSAFRERAESAEAQVKVLVEAAQRIIDNGHNGNLYDIDHASLQDAVREATRTAKEPQP